MSSFCQSNWPIRMIGETRKWLHKCCQWVTPARIPQSKAVVIFNGLVPKQNVRCQLLSKIFCSHFLTNSSSSFLYIRGKAQFVEYQILKFLLIDFFLKGRLFVDKSTSGCATVGPIDHHTAFDDLVRLWRPQLKVWTKYFSGHQSNRVKETTCKVNEQKRRFS